MDTAKIDFNVNDSFGAVTSFVKRLNTIDALLASAGERPKQVCLDLSKCKYLGPDAVVLIARQMLLYREAGIEYTIKRPEGPAALKDFWKISGLESLYTRGGLVDRSYSGTNNNVVPIMHFDKATFQDADMVIKLVSNHQTLSADSEEYLRICVNEVIQNVQDHASSGIGALMSARYVSKMKSIRVAIVDAGVGISRSLSTHYPNATPQKALQWVTKGHYSAKSRPNNMGLGISNLCAIVANEHQGEVFIVSESAAAQRRYNAPLNVVSLGSIFQGTAVFFSLPGLD